MHLLVIKENSELDNEVNNEFYVKYYGETIHLTLGCFNYIFTPNVKDKLSKVNNFNDNKKLHKRYANK